MSPTKKLLKLSDSEIQMRIRELYVEKHELENRIGTLQGEIQASVQRMLKRVREGSLRPVSHSASSP